MKDFDIAQFEDRAQALLAAYKRLQADHRALKASHEAELQRNAETREHLNGVIERIRALETEADNA